MDYTAHQTTTRCYGCDDTGTISYCAVCQYHELDCKCEGSGGPWMPMTCPACEYDYSNQDHACDYCDHYQIEHDHDEANGSTRCTVSTCGCLEYVEGCHDCEAT